MIPREMVTLVERRQLVAEVRTGTAIQALGVMDALAAVARIARTLAILPRTERRVPSAVHDRDGLAVAMRDACCSAPLVQSESICIGRR